MMDTETKTLSLAADFPPASREDWRRLVEQALKGAPFDKLTSTTYDGLTIAPLSRRRADARPLGHQAVPWQIMARVEHPDAAAANRAALDELLNGATGLSLVFAGSGGDQGFGLPPTEAALMRVLEDVRLEAGPAVDFDLSPSAEAAIDAALAKGLIAIEPTRHLRLGHDPIGTVARSGVAMHAWKDQAPHFARRLAALARQGFAGRLAAADGRVIHNAGGSEAQELAFVLATGVAYLRALETADVALASARRLLFFRLAADADQFLTIAKLRSLRKLWARVEAACALDPEPIFIAAETAWRMMTQRDPQVNMLRATVAVFSAAIGGADAITVLPFTAALGLPDHFARRVARNTQLVLAEESHLDKVADPAAGSGAIEDLTDQLCRAAWTLFQEIEAAGGIAAALASGMLQTKVTAIRDQRLAALARRKDSLTGVSIFPNIAEAGVAVDAPLPPPASAAALASLRLAAPFEALRDASDRALAGTGARPSVFLANLGTPADFTARTTFAKNFFEAGGIAAISDENAERPPLIEAFKASGAALACLCSSDKIYEAEAVAAAQAFKSAGARHIYLAGRAGEREAALKEAGVQSFVYEGCDALSTLQRAYDILNIEIG
jgi:methylmalonyl-CoA mutase